MKKLFILLSICVVQYTIAQNPLIIKAVEGNVTKPGSSDQNKWINNEWGGLFFYQGTGASGAPAKLCVTDGTNGGTLFVTDLGTEGNKGIAYTIPAQDFMYIITTRSTFVLVGGTFIITRYDELWKSNGTAAGTTLVYSFLPITGVSISNVFVSNNATYQNYSVSGNTMYFTGYDATNGAELWKTDGTTAGTSIVKDINVGSGNGYPNAFCKIGSDVFFSATTDGISRKLWKTDGSEAGTVQVAVPEPFFIADVNVGFVNNKMIFYAHNTVDGYEPYVSDGTAAGTYMLQNINPSGNSLPTVNQNLHLKANNKYCFFIANNGSNNNLWRTDGTNVGTIKLTPDAQNAQNGIDGSYSDINNTGVWFFDATTTSSEKLYKSDGTTAGTYQATANISYGQKMKIYNGAVWFQARDIGSVANVEPWRCGGNAATTNIAFEVEPGISGSTRLSSNPYAFFVKNNKLYFFASTLLPSGHNLYQYTGDFTFNGSQTGGRWRDSANWNSMMPPGITDTVYVNSGTPNPLNINGAAAYAGVLNMGYNAGLNFTNTVDSLYVHNNINANNNVITGDGVFALYNFNSDTARINGNITIPKLAILSQSEIESGTTNVSANVNFGNNSRFVLNNNQLRMIGSTSSFYNYNSNNYVVTNGTGTLAYENVQAFGRGAAYFPIGTNTHYNLLSLQNFGTTDVFTARVKPGLNMSYTGEIGNANSEVLSNAVNATWFINEGVVGGSDVYMIANWVPSQELSGFNRAQVVLGHYTNNNWSYNIPDNANNNGDGSFAISRNNVTSFSPFGILNSSGTLPLDFLSFSAQKCNTSNVCLNWKTANEQNVSHFEIERSVDGVNYTVIGTVQAGSNSYNYEDRQPNWSSKNLYYRIKQVDNDNRSKRSTIAWLKGDNAGVQVYPTLVKNSFTVQNNTQQTMWLQLTDASGKLVVHQRLVTGTNMISADKLTNGVYFYSIKNTERETATGRIMKQ